MHMKIFRHGTGAGKGVINYLLLERHKPKVIRGNPAITLNLIDSLTTKHKYRSGVLSWEETLNNDEIQKIIADFEAFSFAGIDENSFDCLWVQHTEHDRTELHFCIPRIHLDTQKSFNPMPPKWNKPFGKWRDLQNYKNDWTSPNTDINKDSSHVVQLPDHIHQLKKLGEIKEDVREIVTNFILKGIEDNLIIDRETMLKHLHNAGLETPRHGKNYITIINPENNKRVRLKGEIYNEEWRLENSLKPSKPDKFREKRKRIEELEREVEEIRRSRQQYNIKAFGEPERNRNSNNADMVNNNHADIRIGVWSDALAKTLPSPRDRKTNYRNDEERIKINDRIRKSSFNSTGKATQGFHADLRNATKRIKRLSTRITEFRIKAGTGFKPSLNVKWRSASDTKPSI